MWVLYRLSQLPWVCMCSSVSCPEDGISRHSSCPLLLTVFLVPLLPCSLSLGRGRGRVDADVLSVAERTHSLTLSPKQLGAFALACILCDKKLRRPRLRAAPFSATLHFCCYGRHAVIFSPFMSALPLMSTHSVWAQFLHSSYHCPLGFDFLIHTMGLMILFTLQRY